MRQDLLAFLGFQIAAGADRAACSEGINEPIIPQGIGRKKGVARSEAPMSRTWDRIIKRMKSLY